MCLSHSERATKKGDTDHKRNLHDQMNIWEHNGLFPKCDRKTKPMFYFQYSFGRHENSVHHKFTCASSAERHDLATGIPVSFVS
jgi:hypothetical protein